MRLSDIVSSMNLTIFPIIGLFLFLTLFGVILARTLMADRQSSDRAASMPLDDDATRNSADHQEHPTCSTSTT